MAAAHTFAAGESLNIKSAFDSKSRAECQKVSSMTFFGYTIFRRVYIVEMYTTIVDVSTFIDGRSKSSSRCCCAKTCGSWLF
jgi:hypothetical protein